MDYEYLSNRVKALQRELAEIAEHNRQYFRKRYHSANDRAQHEVWIERVCEIRAESRALMERTAA
jgi:hypothetical protein